MRAARWIAPLALLISSVASAQVMDPTQMSGLPRADKSVAEGLLTVKVLKGDMGTWAPVGTEVHVVGLTKDGKVTNTVAKVNAEGRAEFPGLAHDGSTVYYAMTLLGEERLTSQPILLPPKAGVRMMLSGAKKGDAPIDNEVTPSMGSDPHTGGGAKGAAIPTGEVELLVRGKLEKDLKATLRAVAGGEPRVVALTGNEDTTSARFTGVPVGGPYIAEVTVKGKPYRSTPFLMSATAGVQRMILVYDELLFAVQGGGQPEDDKMWFELTLTLANVSSAPVDPGPDGLVLPLPTGFRNVKIEDENSPFKVADGKGLVSPGPIPPGQLSVNVQFALPVSDGRCEFEMNAPYGMFQSSIAIVKGSSTVVSAAQIGKAPRVQRSDDMREFYVVDGFVVSPGENLRFTIAGLPSVPQWHGLTKSVAGVVVVLLLAFALVIALLGKRAPLISRPADAEAARRELAQRREKLYGELVALERLRAAERIDASDFESQRKAIMTKLVLVHRELDDLDGTAAPGGQARIS